MKNLFAFFAILSLVSCASLATDGEGRIFLYGETHGRAACYEEEFDRWSAFYKQGARDLFVELSYSGGKLLNEWMKAKDDTLLDVIFESISGTQSYSPFYYNFFKRIKASCPKTIFHGIDVEHQPNSIPAYYLNLLEERGLKESSEYKLVIENIADGNDWNMRERHSADWSNRENALVKNFIREYDGLKTGATMMGIFGSAHTYLESVLPQIKRTMASFLAEYYELKGITLETYDISQVVKDITPLSVATLRIRNKEYKAGFFGTKYYGGMNGIYSVEFYRLVDGRDFASLPILNAYLPANNYPVLIQSGDCFCLLFHYVDGRIEKQVYRCDGDMINGMLNSHLVFNE